MCSFDGTDALATWDDDPVGGQRAHGPELMAQTVRWWDMRPAQGRQAKAYTCPICHGVLLAMTPNTLLVPEGDHRRRRHAHTACVVTQRKAGKLLTRAEWERSQRPPSPAKRPWWRRLLGSRGRVVD